MDLKGVSDDSQASMDSDFASALSAMMGLANSASPQTLIKGLEESAENIPMDAKSLPTSEEAGKPNFISVFQQMISAGNLGDSLGSRSSQTKIESQLSALYQPKVDASLTPKMATTHKPGEEVDVVNVVDLTKNGKVELQNQKSEAKLLEDASITQAVQKMNFFERSDSALKGSSDQSLQLVDQTSLDGQKKKLNLSTQSSVDEFAKQLIVQKDLGFGEFVRGQRLGEDSSVLTPQVSKQVQQNLFEDMRVNLSKMQTTQTGGSMTLQLRPGNLGRVEIQVDVQGESVKIEMRAEDKGGEQALRGQIGELKTQLQSIGLKVDELNLQSLKHSSDAQTREEGQQSSHQGHAREQNHKQKQEEASLESHSFEEHLLS
jgi:flagellar hook-length control protein FliK